MSGTGYQDSNCVKTEICEKCKELKTWNYWYHSNPNICDDCYYIDGKYYGFSAEEIEDIKNNYNNYFNKNLVCRIKREDVYYSESMNLTIFECNSEALLSNKKYFNYKDKIFLATSTFSEKYCYTGFTDKDLTK